ncbi:hypothetical protein [Aquihabitans sp. McL0605]|uniref:hypothetical protein n=1 Tax=Aquihabitans sp. McL0605 TaxID=3415671 RepID=UPI003CF9FE50
MGIEYEVISDRLTSEAADLYRDLVAVHLEAGTGDRRFMLMKYLGGNMLRFLGQGHRRVWRDVDPGALDDLAGYGLLSTEYSPKGSPNYRITGESLAFYRWWMRELGAAIDQAHQEVWRAVAGESFAEAHPGASHHLNEAFDLLWKDRLDDQTVSELGDHLRKALMDVVNDVVSGEGGKVEQPVKSLKAWLDTRQIGEREREVVNAVIELARATLRLDHRLNHVRDELELGEPEASMVELRRAAFATAMACEQIGSL